MEDSFFRRAEDEFYKKRLSPKVIKEIKHQTGRTNIKVDRVVRALKAGKRISKTGHIYWETRKNRSDMNPKKRI